MWRALHLLAPDAASAAGLRPTYTEYASSRPYPATLGPAANLTATALRAAMRDYFQDTPFDQTDGFAAGPFGSPARFRVPPELAAEGNWERPIAVSRTIVSYVAVCRGLPPPAGGVLWWGMHSALTSVYVPFPVALLRAAHVALPAGYTNNSAARADRGVGAWQAARCGQVDGGRGA